MCVCVGGGVGVCVAVTGVMQWCGFRGFACVRGCFVGFLPLSCHQFAEMESSVGEVERSRAIYELAINQPVLDMPELLWKSYVAPHACHP